MFLFQDGTALSIQLQTTPTATLSPFERLAKPTLPASPGQADYGAQSYWLLCLPCHGDKGQGLTAEFRQTYPPEEQYCWERGCHGERPYENGFRLPMNVPAVIGPNATLTKFSTAAYLQAYLLAAMPYWDPGSLSEEEAWNITAFLLRENGLPVDGEVNATNAPNISLFPPQTATLPASQEEPATAKQPVSNPVVWLLGLTLLMALFVLLVLRLRKIQ